MMLNIKYAALIVIAVLGLLVYSDTFHNSFHFDDYPQIVNNVSVHQLNLSTIWASYYSRFITGLSFALNYHWGGLDVWGYHAVSLLVHIGVSMAVWWLLSLTFILPAVKREKIAGHGRWIALFAALVFLVHPLQTQPINYIYQRAVLLAAFFYLFSLAFYAKARLSYLTRPDSQVWVFYLAAALAAALLGLFSKEIVISLPFMVCLYEFCFLKEKDRASWPWVVPFFLVVLVLPLIYIATDPALLHAPKEQVVTLEGGMGIRAYASTEPRVMMTYLKLLFVPLHQTVAYDFPLTKSILQPSFILSVVCLTGIFLFAIAIFKKYRLPSFGILWFLMALVPESSFWPTMDVIFEHRLYLPMLGFAVFLTSTVFHCFGQKNSSLAIRMLLLLVAVYSCLTYQRNKVWLNEFTLWDDAVHQSPGSARAHLNRGAIYQKRGDLDAALADYNMVIGLGPVDAVTLSNRGSIFKAKGAYDLALANFNLAIQINPSYAGTYINRGLLYQDEHKFDLGLADFNQAVKLMPYNPEGYINRSAVYFLQYRYDLAWDDLHKAQSLGAAVKPGFLDVLKKASGRNE